MTLMPLTKPNREYFEDLKGHSACLDWAAHDLIEIAKRIEDAGLFDESKALAEIGNDLRAWSKIVSTFSDEVREGLIVRREP